MSASCSVFSDLTCMTTYYQNQGARNKLGGRGTIDGTATERHVWTLSFKVSVLCWVRVELRMLAGDTRLWHPIHAPFLWTAWAKARSCIKTSSSFLSESSRMWLKPECEHVWTRWMLNKAAIKNWFQPAFRSTLLTYPKGCHCTKIARSRFSAHVKARTHMSLFIHCLSPCSGRQRHRYGPLSQSGYKMPHKKWVQTHTLVLCTSAFRVERDILIERGKHIVSKS